MASRSPREIIASWVTGPDGPITSHALVCADTVIDMLAQGGYSFNTARVGKMADLFKEGMRVKLNDDGIEWLAAKGPRYGTVDCDQLPNSTVVHVRWGAARRAMPLHMDFITEANSFVASNKVAR